MTDAKTANLSAMIAEYLTRLLDPPADPGLIRRYSLVAARFQALRLLIDEGKSTPADYLRFRELGDLMRTLTVKLDLPDVATVDSAGPDAVVGVTDAAGFLPLDFGYLIGQSWQESARFDGSAQGW